MGRCAFKGKSAVKSYAVAVQPNVCTSCNKIKIKFEVTQKNVGIAKTCLSALATQQTTVHVSQAYKRVITVEKAVNGNSCAQGFEP